MSGKPCPDGTRILGLHRSVDTVRSPSEWTRRYGARHRFRKLNMPGARDGRIGRVTVYGRGENVLLRWRQDGRTVTETVRPSDRDDVLAHALRRAVEINRELQHEGRIHSSFRKATVREACASFLAGKEASPSSSAATIVKYRQELARVIEFAETTTDGRKADSLDDIGTLWCQQFCRWLDALRTTSNGGRATQRNPERLLASKQKQGIRRRLASVFEAAMLHQPPLLPRDYRNPMTRQLIGVTVLAQHEMSDPPATLDELVAIVPVLDRYGLALLAPLFLFGPRPSELGHVLLDDFDRQHATLRVISRPSTGYHTKGRRGKIWPVN
ncbi:MAG: hypothetical protein ACYS9X_23870, partial [Planctomycetota bacterium]